MARAARRVIRSDEAVDPNERCEPFSAADVYEQAVRRRHRSMQIDRIEEMIARPTAETENSLCCLAKAA